jgi:N-acyl-D-amino-acid deacylase
LNKGGTLMSEHYDVLIRNTKIVDGTGRPAFLGNVGISGEKIVAVGDVPGDAARVIDGDGLVTCPGFVDPHSHADMSLLDYPLAENLVMQGITTCLTGNCGFSMAPIRDTTYATYVEKKTEGQGLEPRTFGEWLSEVEETGLSLNCAPLVGHNTVRGALMGQGFKRSAASAEIEEMMGMVAEAMTNGAFGLSVGLDAAWPGHFADVEEEIVALAKVAQEYGGFFSPHTRHIQNQWPVDHAEEYGYGIFHAPTGEIIAGRYHGLLEAVEISRKANRIPLHIAHLAPAYIVPQPHPDFLDEAAAKATLVQIIDSAREEGLDVTYNVIAWAQGIGGWAPMIESFFAAQLLLPKWLTALSKEGFADQLKTRAFREKVKGVVYSGKFKFGMIHPLTDPYWMDCYRVLRCENKAHEGRTIGEIARERQPEDIIESVYETSLDAVFDILVEDPDTIWALHLDKRMVDAALPVFLQHPAGMPCTDVSAFPAKPSPQDGMTIYGVSPTAYGLYPHYLRLFVKEKRALSLEEAIRKATYVPAQAVLGLKDRGVIRDGAHADIVLFDFERIRERDDFLEPARPPEGIEHVLVNGQVVYEGMAHTGARPGKVLRRS